MQKLLLLHLLQEILNFAPESPAILGVGRTPLLFNCLISELELLIEQLKGFGVERRDRVAMVIPTGPEAAVCFLAVSSTAVCAPLNPALSSVEFEFYFRDLAPKIIIVHPESALPAADVARSMAIPVVEIVLRPADPAGVFSLAGGADLRRHGERPRLGANTGECFPENTILLLHTSGTTARPKMVPLTAVNLCASAKNMHGALHLTAQDRCLNLVPLWHMHGLIGGLLSQLLIGGSVVCPPGFRALRFFDWMEEFQPTWYTAVPTTHQAILRVAAHRTGPVSHTRLRFVRSCSAALPLSVMAQLEAVFSVPVIEAYGMTEASHQIATNRLSPGARKPGSVGLPTGCEIAILDDQGVTLSAEQVGHVIIRGPNVTTGYANDPEPSAKSFVDGWLRTGDQGRVDSDGYLFLTGRTKEIINWDGEQISPREIEEVLIQHPAVREAAAFAVPEDILGEDIVAGVVLHEQFALRNPESMETELKEFAAGYLALFKVPRRIVFLSDIPKDPIGKL
jgi:acyl-CoA synthetase (AMP-forming)/AMP-acid ligase II